MTFGSLVGSRNFIRLVWVSWEVFNHCVAKSCTTTAYRSLFPDSLSSLRILWSSVIISQNFSSFGMTVPARPLQEVHVIFVKQISQFGSFGKSFVIHEKNWRCLHVQAQGFSVALKDNFHPPSFLWTLVASPASHAIDRSVLLRVLHFYLCFRFLVVYAAGFTVTSHSYFYFFRVLDFRCICLRQIQNLLMKMLKKLV